MRFLALFGTIGFVMLGCAGASKTRVNNVPGTPASTVKDFDNMREDFDIAALDDYDIVVEEANKRERSTDDPILGSEDATRDSVGTGYRVQLIQTIDPEEAKNVERDAILRLDADVYRVFDPPYYKVRVGDFAAWRDAEAIQKVAIQKGFREAWVVRTKVNLKKAYQWLNEL